tara:strand:- start:501102 stop:503159 length:2058 start_codon:yes stop_codon:yes gene_type:complete
MTRINTNVPSLVAQNRLQASNSDLQTALTRLSTGLRINSGADDPAGLIASEALRSEITSLGKAITNTRRASQIISTADSALGQVSNLLNDVRGLIVEAANSGALSDEEIAANQLQIDSSLEAINRIAQTTTFQGRKLLDGSLDFVSTIGSVASVSDAKIDQANLGATGQIDVEVVIAAAASQAEITANSAAFTAPAAAVAGTGEGIVQEATINGQVVLITGPESLATITFADSGSGDDTATAALSAADTVLTINSDFGVGGTTDNANILAALNGIEGITATVVSGTELAAAAPADVTATPEQALSITANTLGSEFNNVEIRFNDVNDDSVATYTASAAFDADQKVLTVNYNSAATTTPNTFANIVTAINAVQDDGGDQIFTAVAAADIADNDFTAAAETLKTGTTGGEVLAADLVFQLNGADGAETFNFGAGTSSSQIAAAVNLVSDSTGVAANVVSGALAFNSTAYGSDALVNIDVITEGDGGTFGASLSALRDTGVDIFATVNGIEATGEANTLSINTSSLDLNITVDDASSTNFSFSITGGGALFQLGPDVTSNQQARLGIGSVSTGQIGGPNGRLYELGSGQAKSLINDVNGAAKIIDDVIDKVTGLRGRLGAFQATTLESNLVSLNDTLANLQEAESSIRDADFAQESANLTRAQILVQSGTNVLSLANQNPQNVLSLLR